MGIQHGITGQTGFNYSGVLDVGVYMNGQNDLVDYDTVRLKVEYGKPDGNKELFIGVGDPLTVNNLVGEDGYFNISIEFIRSGYDNPSNGVIRVETYTLDEWIEKCSGMEFDEEHNAWTGYDASLKTAGFGMDVVDNGDYAQGPTYAGKMTFRPYLVCKTGSHSAEIASVTIVAEARNIWYSEPDSNEVTLMPCPLGGSIKAEMDDGVIATVANAGDYVLVDVSSGMGQAQLSEADDIANYLEDGVMERRISKETGKAHFFINDWEIYGVMRNVLDGYASNSTIPDNGEIVLFNDYQPLIDGESNIEVTFPCYVAGNSDKINKCTIAKLFGNSNSKNRLFVSGNPDFPNCDWHSGVSGTDSVSNGDFSYFGDMDYCFYGQSSNAIMGYDNVATDKMVVLKSKSKVEPTNYFRTSGLIQAIDASGNSLKGTDGSALYQESFPLATGNIGAGAMNNRSVVNLNGDTLYLSSENTVCGLDIAGQVGDSQRISYSRSKYIDPELKGLNLSDASLWTDNANLYLFAGDVVYMTNYETFNSETGQYEWFKLDVRNVRCAADVDGVMYFGTEDGKLCRINKDVYEDIERLYISLGGTLYSQDKVTYNSSYNAWLEAGDKLTIKIDSSIPALSLFRRVASVSSASGNGVDLLVNAANNTLRIAAIGSEGETDFGRYKVLIEELAYGGFFYFDKPDGENSIQTTGESDIDVYVPYKLVPVDEAIDEYKVVEGDTEDEIDLSTLEGANLCRPLDGEYEVTDLDKENCNFKIAHNGRVVNVILYADQNMANLSFPSEIRKHYSVKAKYIAAPAVLGGISYRKTIWAWTVIAADKANDLQICQATNEEKLEDMKQMSFSSNIPLGFDFRSLTFTSLDFGKSVIPRKYTYFRPLSVPFISFGFKSEKPANSILTAVSIVYSVPMLGWGNK